MCERSKASPGQPAFHHSRPQLYVPSDTRTAHAHVSSCTTSARIFASILPGKEKLRARRSLEKGRCNARC